MRKGETSRIRVWAPCPPSKRRLQAWRDAGANPDDRPRTYFRLEAVFSEQQVEALPPPAQPAPLGPPIAEVQGDTLAWAQQPLAQLASELGYSVVYRTLAKGHGGSCDPTTRVLTINDDAAINAQVDVACHELAHALVRVDRHDDDPQLDYAAEELAAESGRFQPGWLESPMAPGLRVGDGCHRRTSGCRSARMFGTPSGSALW